MASKNVCDLCREQGRQKDGERFCPLCEEILCSNCTSYHKTSKATKAHHLVDIEIAPAYPLDFLTEHLCERHDGIQIEYFCTDHDDIFCRACLAETHKQCEKVVTVEEACKDAKRSLLDEAKKETRRFLDTVEALEKEKDANISVITKERSEIRKEIGEMKKEIIERINELELSLVDELDVKTDKINDEIERNSSKIFEIKQQNEKQMQKIQFVDEHGTDKQAFILAHKLKPFLRDTEDMVTGMTTNAHIFNLSFSLNKNAVSSLLTIGTITENEKPTDVRYTPVKLQQAQFKSVKSFPIKSCHISYQFYTTGTNVLGMTVTGDKKLLLCNYTEKNGILVHTENGLYTQTITMKHKPFDIAYIPGTDRFVVSLPDIKSVQFVHCDMKPGKAVKLHADCKSKGIAATSKNIYTADWDRILVLNTDGQIQTQIILTESDVAYYIYAQESGQIRYISSNDVSKKCGLIGTDRNTTISIEHNISSVRKIIMDRDGYVYIGNENEGKIHRLNGDLTPDMIIKNDRFQGIGAICFNNDCSKLFVANQRGKSILVLSCN